MRCDGTNIRKILFLKFYYLYLIVSDRTRENNYIDSQSIQFIKQNSSTLSPKCGVEIMVLSLVL